MIFDAFALLLGFSHLSGRATLPPEVMFKRRDDSRGPKPPPLPPAVGLTFKRPKSTNYASIGVMILVLIASFGIWRVWLHYEVTRQLAQVRAAGYPTSGEEVNAWIPTVPDAENGALVMQEAFKLLQTLPDARSNRISNLEWVNRTNHWSDETRAIVLAYVRTNEAAVVKAREAVKFARFKFPVDYSYGFETLLPHLPALKNLSACVGFRSMLQAETNGVDGWRQDLLLQLEIARALDDDRMLISHLVHDSVTHMAQSNLERALNRFTPDAGSCEKLREAFIQSVKPNALGASLAGEMGMMIPYFRMTVAEWNSFRSDSEDSGSVRRPPQKPSGKGGFMFYSGFLERDLSFYLKTMERGIHLAALPPREMLEQTNHFEVAAAIAKSRFHIWSAMMLPALSKAAAMEGVAVARVELATTALAVERHRLRYGDLPEDLHQLIPEFLKAMPEDPFSSEPLVYRTLNPGYQLYSVGPDGRDDGGLELPEPVRRLGNSPSDITFTVDR